MEDRFSGDYGIVKSLLNFEEDCAKTHPSRKARESVGHPAWENLAPSQASPWESKRVVLRC